MNPSRMNRRRALQAAGVGLGALSAATLHAADDPPKPKGNLKQSVCAWCYRMPAEKLAEEAKKIGYQSVELLGPDQIKKVKAVGLTCAVMNTAGSIADGLNRKENHDRIVKQLESNIEFAAAEGVPNVLVMSGNRKGLDDAEGMENCAVGLKRVMKLAEEKKVTVLMEGLNSKVDHKDYMYDLTKWGVGLCKKVGSERFKLLYDIYHMQIMEGDIIRTIRDNKQYIGHYHTGGNPGRNEIDETQELNYPAIVKAILATGFTGFLAQEFIPKRDPLASLAQGFRICDV